MLGLPDPDAVGSAEYRAIYELIEDDDKGEDRVLAIAVVREFEKWAWSMRQTLERDM